MDLTQIFISISLTIIALAIAACTYYLIGLIKELRNAVFKATSILDDTHKITGSIARPVTTFSDFLMGFKNGFQLFNSFFEKDKKE